MWWRLRLSALKPMHGGNANTNAGENCGYRFQLNVHSDGNYEEFDRN
jgi:hypothetical protein